MFSGFWVPLLGHFSILGAFFSELCLSFSGIIQTFGYMYFDLLLMTF